VALAVGLSLRFGPIVSFCARQNVVVTRERHAHAALHVRDAAPGVTTSTSEADPLFTIASAVPECCWRKSLKGKTRAENSTETLCATLSYR